MDQYNLLNKGNPYGSMQEAKKFIQIIQNSYYGAGKDRVPMIHRDVEFEVTESKDGFYIWYKLPESIPELDQHHLLNNSYYLLDTIKPINSREEAEEYIKKAEVFIQELGLPICADFQITESEEKKFHIWYKTSEKHTL